VKYRRMNRQWRSNDSSDRPMGSDSSRSFTRWNATTTATFRNRKPARLDAKRPLPRRCFTECLMSIDRHQGATDWRQTTACENSESPV
jgi:hypothetical protein